MLYKHEKAHKDGLSKAHFNSSVPKERWETEMRISEGCGPTGLAHAATSNRDPVSNNMEGYS